VVASAGTALTTEQLLLIRRFTSNLHLLYDGDTAGIGAALRGLDLALELDLNVRITPLPHPEDPDSFLRKVGITAFTEHLVSHAKNFIAFKASILLNDAGKDPVKKANAVHAIVDSIARVPDPIKRSFFIKQCALLTGLSKEVLTAEANKAMLGPKQRTNHTNGFLGNERPSSSLTPRSSSLENHLIYLLLEHGAEVQDVSENITVAENLLANIEDIIEHFEDPFCQRICQECAEMVLAKKPVTTQHFIAHEDLELSGFVADLLHENDIPIDPHWEQAPFFTKNNNGEKGYTEDITKTILRLKLKVANLLCEQNLQRIKDASPDDEQAMTKLLKVHEKLNGMRRNMAKSLGLVRL
jgi:DNA primase